MGHVMHNNNKKKKKKVQFVRKRNSLKNLKDFFCICHITLKENKNNIKKSDNNKISYSLCYYSFCKTKCE